MKESRKVIALKIMPRNIAVALKELKDFLLNQARRPNVVEAGGDSKEKLILLSPDAATSLVSRFQKCAILVSSSAYSRARTLCILPL